MKRNESGLDRGLRVVIGIVLAAFALTGGMGALLTTVLAVVALVLVITGVAGFCPMYAVLGLSTCAADR